MSGIMRPADMTGLFNRRAWQSRVARVDSARLDSWILECPHAHPFWTKWLASVVTLADIEGVKPASKSYPEAEYELMVAAMNPNETIDIDGGVWPIMNPLELVFQFHGIGDGGARRLLHNYVHTVIERSLLSPDADFRPRWMVWCGEQVDTLRKAQ